MSKDLALSIPQLYRGRSILLAHRDPTVIEAYKHMLLSSSRRDGPEVRTVCSLSDLKGEVFPVDYDVLLTSSFGKFGEVFDIVSRVKRGAEMMERDVLPVVIESELSIAQCSALKRDNVKFVLDDGTCYNQLERILRVYAPSLRPLHSSEYAVSGHVVD